MPENHAPHPHLETDIWRWLLFESGLSRRRAREIILQSAQSNALALFWQAGPEILAQQLALTPEEAALFQQALAQWPQIEARFEKERAQGLISIRLNQPEYPDTLIWYLPAERRPLLLFARGERALLDLPLVLPVAGTPPDEAAVAWVIEALSDLAVDGALPLLTARSGFEAQLARAFLDATMPFALVLPQGLGAYTPPAGLQQALDEDRVLLLSPFQPDWQPPTDGENPMLPHAIAFAEALADAWLALSGPVPGHPSQQPCFRRPEMPETADCSSVYEGGEALFQRLMETAMAVPPGVSISAATPEPVSEPEPELAPLTPEEILSTLAQGGHIPPALAARLKKSSQD